jgi:hypothetical protein
MDQDKLKAASALNGRLNEDLQALDQALLKVERVKALVEQQSEVRPSWHRSRAQPVLMSSLKLMRLNSCLTCPALSMLQTTENLQLANEGRQDVASVRLPFLCSISLS